MAKMTGARFMAETVLGYGLTHVFYMPFIAPRALKEMHERGIVHVQTHGEKPAAYMADGYARARRAPGICMAQSVGALNLAAGLQDAYLACSPVIAITGREFHSNQNRNAYQEVDHVSPFAAVTKSSVFVSKPEEFPLHLRQAFRAATSGTPGPVHLDLEGLAGQGVVDKEADFSIDIEEMFSRVPPFRPEADAESISAALKLLAKAERPVIIAGGGVTASDARAELLAFAEKLSIPVATALNAKAMFPPDHPLAVGVPGYYSRECANQALHEADLVFFIGSHSGGQVTNNYAFPVPGTTVIQLDIEGAEIGRNFPIKAGLQGDVKATLKKMIAAAETAAPRKPWLSRVQALVAEWKAQYKPLLTSDVSPMRPERLCNELTACLPSDAILVSDTGHSGIWTGTMIDFKHPTQSYLRCAGSLGWAFPAAMGAKCAAPDRPVICFTGDGGIWYHMQELDTARRYGINTITVLNNNHSFNQEQFNVELTYGGRSQESDDLWLFPETDFAAIAKAMGCFGTVVTKPSEIAGAIDQAIAAKKPAVIDVRTHIEGIAPKAWSGY